MAAFDLEWLEDFLEVAERRNFRRAAAARGLTQSTLSRRIQSLEAALGGTTLLDRDKGLALTEPGKVFQEIATKMVVDFRDAKFRIEQMAPPAGTRIYTVHSLSATFVPRVVHKIRELLNDKEYDLNISIVVGNISECTEGLASGATPFMISYETEKYRLLFSDDMLTTLFPSDRAHVRKERILSVRIAQDQLIPVCATANDKKYREMYASGIPIPYFAYSDGTYLSELVKEKIEALNLEHKLKRAGDAQMADTLRNIARDGDGIAWVLESTARNAIDKEEIMRFDFDLGDESNVDLDIKLFRLADYSSPPIDRIWKISKALEEELAKPSTWLTS